MRVGAGQQCRSSSRHTLGDKPGVREAAAKMCKAISKQPSCCSGKRRCSSSEQHRMHDDDKDLKMQFSLLPLHSSTDQPSIILYALWEVHSKTPGQYPKPLKFNFYCLYPTSVPKLSQYVETGSAKGFSRTVRLIIGTSSCRHCISPFLYTSH